MLEEKQISQKKIVPGETPEGSGGSIELVESPPEISPEPDNADELDEETHDTRSSTPKEQSQPVHSSKPQRSELPDLSNIIWRWGLAGELKLFFLFLPAYALIVCNPYVPTAIRDYTDFKLEPNLWAGLILCTHLQLAWSYCLWRIGQAAQKVSPHKDNFAPGLAGLLGLTLGPLTTPALVSLAACFLGPLFQHGTGAVTSDIITQRPLVAIELIGLISFGPLFLASISYLRFFQSLRGALERNQTAIQQNVRPGSTSVVAGLLTSVGLLLPPVVFFWLSEGNSFQWSVYGLVFAFQLFGFWLAFRELKPYRDALNAILSADKTTLPTGVFGKKLNALAENISRASRMNTAAWCAIGFVVALVAAIAFGRCQLYIAGSHGLPAAEREKLFNEAIQKDPTWAKAYIHKARWLAQQNRREEAGKTIEQGVAAIKDRQDRERLQAVMANLNSTSK